MDYVILESLSESEIVDFTLIDDSSKARLVSSTTALASSGSEQAFNSLIWVQKGYFVLPVELSVCDVLELVRIGLLSDMG